MSGVEEFFRSGKFKLGCRRSTTQSVLGSIGIMSKLFVVVAAEDRIALVFDPIW